MKPCTVGVFQIISLSPYYVDFHRISESPLFKIEAVLSLVYLDALGEEFVLDFRILISGMN